VTILGLGIDVIDIAIGRVQFWSIGSKSSVSLCCGRPSNTWLYRSRLRSISKRT